MKYVIRKGGMYYRPGAAGYTQHLHLAGLFEVERAAAEQRGCDEVTAIPISEKLDQLADITRTITNAVAVQAEMIHILEERQREITDT